MLFGLVQQADIPVGGVPAARPPHVGGAGRRTVQACPFSHLVRVTGASPQPVAAVCWAAAMLAVFAPLAVHLYRRKALG